MATYDLYDCEVSDDDNTHANLDTSSSESSDDNRYDVITVRWKSLHQKYQGFAETCSHPDRNHTDGLGDIQSEEPGKLEGTVVALDNGAGYIKPDCKLPKGFRSGNVLFNSVGSVFLLGNKVTYQLVSGSENMPLAKTVCLNKTDKLQDASSTSDYSIDSVGESNYGHIIISKGKGDHEDNRKKEVKKGRGKLKMSVPEDSSVKRKKPVAEGKIMKGIVATMKQFFGFIRPSEELPEGFEKKDVHFNKAKITGENKELEENDEVEFELDLCSKKKPSAVNIRLLRKSTEREEDENTNTTVTTKFKNKKEQLSVRGRLITIKDSENGKYGFVKVDKMPEGYRDKNVHVHLNKVSCGGIALVHGDMLEIKLGCLEKDKERPTAMRATLIYCKPRSPTALTEYLEKIQSTVHQSDEPRGKSEVLLGLISCHAPWEAVGNCDYLQVPTVSLLFDILIHLEERAVGLRERYKDLLRSIARTRLFHPWQGLLKEIIKNMVEIQDRSTLNNIQNFLLVMMKHVPEKSRAIVSLIEPMISKGTENNTEYFLFKLLKETSKQSSDNVEDMEWNELPLVPTTKELLGGPLESRINLSEVKVKGPYDTPQHYIDTYFRLLRADCFDALSKGIRALLWGKLDKRDMNVYFNVRIAGIQIINSDSGIAIALQVTPHRNISNWATCSNLMFGNLLCISPSGSFKDVIWATVGNRDVELLQRSRVILVELLTECNATTDSQSILRMEQCSGSMVMTESPSYYRAYQPVLRALQTMDPEQLPFKDELVDVQPPKNPKYVNENPDVDASIIYPNTNVTNRNFGSADNNRIPLLQLLQMPHGAVSMLDKSQENAVIGTLQRRIAIIQGPPGTGKTFIGVKILQVIQSMSTKPDSPILVLTYKNHSLDEFLKQIIELYPDSVARIGGRSQDPDVQRCNINELKKQKIHRKTQALHQLIQELYGQSETLKPQVERAARNVNSSKRFGVECFASNAQPVQIEKLLSLCDWSNVKATLKSSKDQAGDAIRKRDIQAIVDKLKGHGIKNVFDSQAPNDLYDDLKALLCIALQKWVPGEDVFKVIDQKFVTQQINFSALEDTNGGEALSGEERGQDERDIEDEQRERLSALSNTKSTNTENLVLFTKKSKPGSLNNIELLGCMTYAMDQLPLASLRAMENPWDLSDEHRALLIQTYLYEQVAIAGEEFEKKLQEYQRNGLERSELELQHKAEMLSSMKVIGMTITGASIHQSLLTLVKPEIVLVEEAAEVLEPQLLASLGNWTQHLILIGDHKQLRPPVASYDLVKNYNFDISMMERLINNNSPHEQLLKQNRMRPEFAELLKDIYPKLESNLDRVNRNQPPACVATSLFFWNHSDPEKDERSYINEGEADRAVQLALFLVKQGYSADQVTILGAYQGQVSLIRKKIRLVEQGNPSLFAAMTDDDDNAKSIRIGVHTIDLFQGDENEVVIISLVRSNNKGKRGLGFLKTFNRRCVAQSRAKCGMYFIGNADTLSWSHTWKPMIDSMKEGNNVGSAITLQCPKHSKESRVEAFTAKDVPLGNFCKVPCGQIMSCHIHDCSKTCQPPHDHSQCRTVVLFEHETCGHQGKKFCYADPENIKCKKNVPFKYSSCGHIDTRECCERQDTKICKASCPRLLTPCGHSCALTCGEKCNPDMCETCERIRAEEEKKRLEAEKAEKKSILAKAEEKIKELKQMPLSRGCIKKNLSSSGDDASEYYDVEDRIKRYIQAGHNWYPEVTKIEYLTNIDLETKWYESKKYMFDPRRSELKFHGTSADAVSKIIESGFILPTNPGMFGAGVYFASDSSKSAQGIYTKGSNMLLLCDVLLGKTKTVDRSSRGMNGIKLKHQGYDSLFAKRNTRDTGGVLYDELVVYEPARALPKYLVHYKEIKLTDPTVQSLISSYGVGGTTFKKLTLLPSRSVDLSKPEDIHFRVAESQFLRLMQIRGTGAVQCQIKSVDFYINPPLVLKFDAMHNQMKQDYPNSAEGNYILAFHGTQPQNIDNIVKQNFSLAKLASNTGNRGAYGAGIYFSEFPDVSIGYGKSLLLCKVLQGKSYKCTGAMLGAPLQSGYDSHIVRVDSAGRGHEVVIYNPDQILPCYVINL